MRLAVGYPVPALLTVSAGFGLQARGPRCWSGLRWTRRQATEPTEDGNDRGNSAAKCKRRPAGMQVSFDDAYPLVPTDRCLSTAAAIPLAESLTSLTLAAGLPALVRRWCLAFG